MHKWVSNAEFKRGAKDSSSGMGSWMLFWFKVFTRGREGGGEITFFFTGLFGG